VGKAIQGWLRDYGIRIIENATIHGHSAISAKDVQTNGSAASEHQLETPHHRYRDSLWSWDASAPSGIGSQEVGFALTSEETIAKEKKESSFVR